MKDNRGYTILGAVLIVLGVLFLLQNLNVFGGFEGVVWQIIWGILFAGGGVAFLAAFASDPHKRWWAAIPGFTLLGLGGLIAFGDRLGEIGGGLFLAAIGLSFLVVFLVRRDFWWAIIPAGTLLTLAVIASLGAALDNGEMVPGILFLGLAVTFFAVYALPSDEGRRKWALIPAGILAVMGIAMSLAFGEWINYLWPVLLIIGGAYVLFRALMQKR